MSLLCGKGVAVFPFRPDIDSLPGHNHWSVLEVEAERLDEAAEKANEELSNYNTFFE